MTPLWRKAFDAIERPTSAGSEAWIQSDTFMDLSSRWVHAHVLRMHENALGVPADEVVCDLEEAVAPGAKQQVREAIAATLGRPEWAKRVVRRYRRPDAAAGEISALSFSMEQRAQGTSARSYGRDLSCGSLVMKASGVGARASAHHKRPGKPRGRPRPRHLRDPALAPDRGLRRGRLLWPARARLSSVLLEIPWRTLDR